MTAERAMISAQAQPINADADIDDSDRDPNAIVFCNVDRLTVREIPLNARHVIVDFYLERREPPLDPDTSSRFEDAQFSKVRLVAC
jgi:hypothetical protein